jgi:hypothetical protein
MYKLFHTLIFQYEVSFEPELSNRTPTPVVLCRGGSTSLYALLFLLPDSLPPFISAVQHLRVYGYKR